MLQSHLFIWILSLIVLCPIWTNAQVTNAIVHFTIPETEDTVGMSESDLQYVLKEYWVSFQKASSTERVRVKMGVTEGSEDVLSRTFDLQVDTSYEDLTSLNIFGDTVKVGLGQYNGLRRFHLQLVCLDMNGNVLDTVNLEHPSIAP